MPLNPDPYRAPPELVLGTRLNQRVPVADQKRQRKEVEEILSRLRTRPGVILADEVGMGKTFVALAIAYSTAVQTPRGPVIVMAPAHLIDKWEQDLKTFCELYLDRRRPVRCDATGASERSAPDAVRYGVARHSVELMKLLDDPPRRRPHLILLAQGAMSRRQTDKWVRLALIAETLRRHATGRAQRLIQVRRQIHRFLAELLWAIGEQRAHDWGEDLWTALLKTDSSRWREIYNGEVREGSRQLDDDPVPKSVARALQRTDLSPLVEALKQMPLRARGGSERISQRLAEVRNVLRDVEQGLWKELLAKARWRSPLLIMDEAHHLKNPGTSLARQLQSPESELDLRTGDGAMARRFDRMLFLSATPFQLGHHELVRVLERFGDVRWDSEHFDEKEKFLARLQRLGNHLDQSQRAAVSLQRGWSRLRPEDCGDEDVDAWWARLRRAKREELTPRQRAVVEGFETAHRHRDEVEKALRPWILRHNKDARWSGTTIERRSRIDGAAIVEANGEAGLPVPGEQLLPFFLAARSAVQPGKDLLGEALCSSYEAFRNTRSQGSSAREEHDDELESGDLALSGWYLREFDSALAQCTGSIHPKIEATVRKTVDLWESGEKVLVFAFYRQTCAALRLYISQEIERRTSELARQRLSRASGSIRHDDASRVLKRIQDRFFDDPKSPGRRELDRALDAILVRQRSRLRASGVQEKDVERIAYVMRRFLRVPTTLVRCFPLERHDELSPSEVVRQMLDAVDASNLSWKAKFENFVAFLARDCSATEREDYLKATEEISTRNIRARGGSSLPNVQVATGTTKREIRSRLMRSFNTPFFPGIFVCSQVMGEGVDLQRHCRHVIHHDLAWNPSSIEQRTGRVDRLGCKAEGRESICVYLPYLSGAADERQFRVMSEREQWFRVVMGQDEVARLISPDSTRSIPLPRAIGNELSFDLQLNT